MKIFKKVNLWIKKIQCKTKIELMGMFENEQINKISIYAVFSDENLEYNSNYHVIFSQSTILIYIFFIYPTLLSVSMKFYYRSSWIYGYLLWISKSVI